ncbi:MAG TPA: antitoxin VapB family protein [Candidatus Nanoarchaeia archaeon]|nr:antitoxin VapB family protein [Candidatus Nanoarchaeia archaeon]
MATKCITITSKAYHRLASLKEHNESFSEVVMRLTKRSSLRDLIGLFTKKEAYELRESVKSLRERMRKEIDETARRL